MDWGAGAGRSDPFPDAEAHAFASDSALRLFRSLAWVTASVTFVVLLVGAGVVATGAGLSCPGWPLCGGRAIPVLAGIVVVEWSHRVGALAVSVLSLVTAASAWPLRGRGPWVPTSLAVVVLLAAQVVLGAIVVGDRLSPWAVVAHEGLGILLLCLWAGVAVLATWQPRPVSAPVDDALTPSQR